MGVHDSSRTRVAPVFARLVARDPDWPAGLLALPHRFDGVKPLVPEDLGLVTECAFWPAERRLDPPPTLLSWLVENRRADPPSNFGTASSQKREKRRLLFGGDLTTQTDALALLSSRGYERGGWHVFEGQTSADVYIETPRLIVLIEGKRTEPAPTTYTTWMPIRHQILRNIDAVWDRRGDRSIVAFFIVEGEEPDPSDVPYRWQSFANATVSQEALTGSLPHRSPGEQDAIAQCFAGVTTWQAVCREFGIPWHELPDTVS